MLNQNSHFSYNPTTLSGIVRSKFDMSHRVKTSFNVGELVPFDVIEVLPGDSHNIKTSMLTRLQTLLTPMMDDLYLDVFYFFVPNRLLWEHWKNFMGESEIAWKPTTTYTVPTIEVKPTDQTAKTILDYMGVPVPNGSFTGSSLKVNALPIRAYSLIWNEWFRDQNLQDPILVPVDDSNYEFDSSKPWCGGSLLYANKFHDYFTSCLPSPQKGPDVSLPLFQNGRIPVVPTNDGINWKYFESGAPMQYVDIQGTPERPIETGSSNVDFSLGMHVVNSSTPGQLIRENSTAGDDNTRVIPANLYAIADSQSVQTINSLRLAFATQQLYELDARGGTRYVEILKSHFGVVSPDARQQRPELLSYDHIAIAINQVVQQSGDSSDETFLGDVGAMSVTASSDNSFVKSFTEHGFLIGLCVARYKHTYQQGLNRMWSRQTRFDYYWPVFGNLGEQPVLNKEIFVDWDTNQADTPTNEEVFGYQEAWAEYRFIPDRTSSEMRSTYPQSLDVWHLGDDYSKMPKLSSDWIKEDTETVNRVLAVSSKVSNQIFVDFYIKDEATRPLPKYSIPGLTRM